MAYSVTLSNEDFKLLTQSLSTISSFLSDVDIRKGVVRQYNLAKTLILNLDMSNIFKEDLCCSNIKAKIPIFQIMADDGKDVTITCEEKKEARNRIENIRKYWYLNNGISLFRFVWTDANKLSTKYFNDNEWSDKVAGAQNSNLICTITMEDKPELIRKIKKVCETFNSGDIAFKNDSTGYSLQTQSNDKVATGKLFSETADLGLSKTYMIGTKVDFITDGIIKSISYYKPYFKDPNMTEDNTSKATCYLVADCQLNDKVSFKTYNISSVVITTLEPGKANNIKRKESVIINEPKITNNQVIAQQQVVSDILKEPVYNSIAETNNIEYSGNETFSTPNDGFPNMDSFGM